jgi:hypothetical protein
VSYLFLTTDNITKVSIGEKQVMPTLEELKHQAKELEIEDIWFTRKEFNHLPKIFAEDEKLRAFTSGLMDGKTWLIVATNKRVIFLDKGILYGLKQKEIPLEKINSIGQKQGLVLGEIHVWDGASNMIIKNVSKKYITGFINVINEALEELKQPKRDNSMSIANELSKLADLRKQGVLTEKEFKEQKTNLLGKIKAR